VDVNANGFTISLNGTEISKNNSGQYMINDPKDTTGSVTLVKVNEDGTTQLSGAKFDISTYVTTSGMYLNPVPHEDIGSKEITGLTLGTKYQLKETKAPDGYIRLGDIFYFQIKLDGTVQVTDESGNVIEDFSGLMISLDNKTISVKNTPGQTLPMTGGPGTFIYTLSGITLLMASALMYIFRMRRRERRVR